MLDVEPAAHLDHDLALDDLDALAGLLPHRAVGLAEAALVGVEQVPALPRRVLDAALLEQGDDGVGVGLARRGQAVDVEALRAVSPDARASLSSCCATATFAVDSSISNSAFW